MPSPRPSKSPPWREALFERLTQVQTEKPWPVLVVAVVTVALALFFASKLSLKTAMGELLPENKESVIVAEQVNERLASMSTLTVVAEGSDNEGLKRFIDALAPELRKIGPPDIGSVDEGVQEAREFFKERRFLYAPLKEVEEIHDEIVERYDYEVAQKAGTWLDDDYEPPPLTEESLRKRLEERAKKSGIEAKAKKTFPDGYYLNPDKHVAAVLIRTPIGSGDLERSEGLKTKVRAAIERASPQSHDPTMKVSLAGNLVSAAEVYSQIKGDLAHVGFWGVVLILSVVFLYYLRIRTVLAMTLTVGIGATWTFGLAYLLIGHLNSSTGFLFSIVVGNGINFGIIYMARYLEARRDSEAPDSVRTAHRETWLPTLTAAGAASMAYGSLAVTDFRGFKHFGVIGGTGMLLCWIATFLFLPSILILFERVSPIKPPVGIVAKLRGLYGRPFALVASRFPRSVTVIATAISIGSFVLAYQYIAADPMEYNMRNIGNDDVSGPSETARLNKLVDEITGRQGQDGIAVATDRIDQVLPLKAALEKVRDAAPADRKPFNQVVTVHSLLPTDQEAKLELVIAARSKIKRAHDQGFLDDEQWKKVEELLPEENLKPISIDDLPAQVVRSFTEKDGTRGRLVYITPASGRSVWNGTYLIEWAASFRRTELPDGSVIKGSGRSVIFADVILAVGEDAPKAITVAIVGTLIIILLAFRARWSGLAVFASVLVGLGWTLAVLAVFKSDWPWSAGGQFRQEAIKLNFLNFVALPITIGVGADYAVNVMQRYHHAGGAIRRVVVETGGAVVLCSLTTMLGYSALTMSVNRAIQSFGIAAAAGEICCVLTGVLVLPAVLVWRAGRKGGDREEGESAPAATG